jgi:flagellar biosynthetic protein FlhB
LLAAVVLLGTLGDDLALGLVGLVRAPLEAIEVSTTSTPPDLVAQLRDAAWRVVGPGLTIVVGSALVMVAVHQAQVGGLWAPGLLAPDVGRLLGGGGGFAARAGRGVWSLAKAVVLVALTALVIRSGWAQLVRLTQVEDVALARGAAMLVLRLARWVAVAMLCLGAIDFALCWRRVEDTLRQTPDEYREDLRAADGDPALRARRRRAAQDWRRDGAEVLPGARLLLLGTHGLVVLLGGGPPPGRVTVRQVARGASASILRRQAEEAGLPALAAPALAAHFARGRARGTVMPPDLAQELAEIWPGEKPGNE